MEQAGLDSRPVGILDLDDFDANAAELSRRAGSKPIRVASKSLRIRFAVQRALARRGYAGVLAFSLHEAIWLAESGIRDIVVGYPCTDTAALAALAASEVALEQVTLMVDDTAQLDALAAAAPNHPPVQVAIELDASYRPVRWVGIGAARSPLRTAADVAALGAAIMHRRNLALVGMMAYEGQIAGVPNAVPGPRGMIVRRMQRASAADIGDRRAQAVAALSSMAELRFVNGGGTGSLESTAAEAAVSEVAAGSGLIGPGLFDGYRGFKPRPALHFGLQVVRRPGPGIVTVHGGGWIASGPPGTDRQPTIAWPRGLKYRGTEGAGEVQTPLAGAAANTLALGDTVYFRHAKAGELAEHLNEVAVYSAGRIIECQPTYRGEGKAFL
nr:alanine racemase [Paeniglutamicibacter psychrophenolicus]